MDRYPVGQTIPDWPALHGQALIQRGKARFQSADHEIAVTAPAALLTRLAELCDGRHTREEILRQLSFRWRIDDVKALLERLAGEGVLVEAADRAAALWKLASNPQRFVEPPTRAKARELAEAAQKKFDPRPDVEYQAPPDFALRELLDRRRSSRTFSASEVSEEAVLGLLWAAYGAAGAAENGMRRRTVPSGGALFPLELFYCNLRPAGKLEPGIYAVHYSADGGVGLARWTEDAHAIAAALLEPDLLRSAQGVVVICGRFSSSARKYGNRALSLVTLEAGHAVQNALLAATALELAAVELCGFVEEHMAKVCGLSSEVTPLTLLVFGRPASADEAQTASLARASAPEFQWADVRSDTLALSQHLGMARFDNGRALEWCWGRDPDPLLAHDKAVAEAWERQAYRQIGGTKIVSAPYSVLAGAVDPATLVRYADWQYQWPGFRWPRFEPAAPRDWVACERLDGAAGQAWVPVELVFHMESLDKAQKALALSRADSSGVAAYASIWGAIERALLELIERDAFMVNWLTRRASPVISRASLPADIARRVAALERAGFRIVFKDLSLDTVPVVLAFGQSVALHRTAVATAASYDAEEALQHAFGELESVIAAALARGALPPIETAGVQTPGEHLQLYEQRRYFRRADWIAGDATSLPLDDVARGRPRALGELLNLLHAQGYRVLWRDMSIPPASLHQGRTPLYIARVLVPGLLPISFGYGNEVLGLPRLESFGANWAHSRRKPCFPHPFA